jgi:hypothetical protein
MLLFAQIDFAIRSFFKILPFDFAIWADHWTLKKMIVSSFLLVSFFDYK